VAGAAALGLCGALAIALRRLARRAPGDVPRAVVTMIAAIALYDAALIASSGAVLAGVMACGFFGLTLALQRVAAGT
jgi:4-hydroxybenzoate polyprenyltransferase